MFFTKLDVFTCFKAFFLKKQENNSPASKKQKEKKI